jgi:hypothetical protein
LNSKAFLRGTFLVGDVRLKFDGLHSAIGRGVNICVRGTQAAVMRHPYLCDGEDRVLATDMRVTDFKFSNAHNDSTQDNIGELFKQLDSVLTPPVMLPPAPGRMAQGHKDQGFKPGKAAFSCAATAPHSTRRARRNRAVRELAFEPQYGEQNQQI